MPFVVYCLDRPDAGDLRQRTRADHLDYMIAHGDQVAFGGPLQTDDGSRVIGSLMVLSHETREAIDRFLDAEPYGKVDLIMPGFTVAGAGLLLSELFRVSPI